MNREDVMSAADEDSFVVKATSEADSYVEQAKEAKEASPPAVAADDEAASSGSGDWVLTDSDYAQVIGVNYFSKTLYVQHLPCRLCFTT